ncbi:hypothetical protein FA15DRAFT_663051 [Coprinopsis marcescibilis]|uniref:Uncharacterized protein n=1 Tax=Coprinopsis marcescibilis TaxID=230819 RepID=A0A5C3LAB5_COPMA|nr:hypothetical protein FA15DRAFT_663051 [Coprinopsis marcescibilis]
MGPLGLINQTVPFRVAVSMSSAGIALVQCKRYIRGRRLQGLIMIKYDAAGQLLRLSSKSPRIGFTARDS